MQRVTRSTAAAVLPAAPASPGTPGYFTGGDPVSNVPATVPGYEWFNGVQEELIGVIIRSGLTPDQADLAQLRKSLDRLFGGGLRTVSANTTLTPNDAGLVLVDAATASCTITLPAANAANGRPLRFTFIRVDTAAANTVTIERAGADTIEGLMQIGLGVGRRLTMVSDGASAWRVTAANGLHGEMQVFISSGTFTVPAGVTRVKVRVWGGGGGGGGAAAGGAGSGGGGGGYAEGLYSVTPGASYAVTVGTGGIAGVQNSNNGGAGGTSSFGNLASATGGQGGLSTTTGTKPGVAGGAGSGGIINLTGQSTAGSYQLGSAFLASGGGAAPFGGAGTNPSVDGPLAAAFPGGGASGGAAGFAGGVGANGLVIVEW